MRIFLNRAMVAAILVEDREAMDEVATIKVEVEDMAGVVEIVPTK